MKLPNVANAVVSPTKVIEYLLSSTHRDGQHKSRFFSQFGHSQDNWQLLAEALLEHPKAHEIAKVEPAAFGTRFVVEGIMKMPDGRPVELRTVWYIREEEDFPRFVTAYPLHNQS